MLQRALALVAVLVLVAVPTLAADPGARSPISFPGAVNDVALAADEGSLAIATQDPGSRLTVPPNPSEEVWHLYSADGRALLQADDADIDACDSGNTLDDCQSHATHVAISNDGSRMVVASQADNGPVLIFARELNGPLPAFHDGLAGNVVDLAMSEDGMTVALITNVGTTSQSGRVYLYNWAAGTSTTPNLLWQDELAGGALGDLAISPDGQSLSVTQGSDHHRYRRANNVQVTDTNFSGDGVDTAIANGGGHLSVAGSSDGWFILYSDSTPAGSRDVRIRDEDASLDAVAIRRDATAIAVANAAGNLWVYRMDPLLAPIPCAGTSSTSFCLIGKVALGSPAREVSFASGGQSVAVAHGNAVSHYAVEPNGLVKLWSATLASSSGDVAIDANGDRVAAATGTQTIVYEAKHKVDVTAGTAPTATPGQQISIPVTFSNAGNRMENAALTLSGPAGWGATLSKSSLRLAPDAPASALVNVTVPATEAPGTKEVTLTSNMGVAGTVATKIPYTVPTVDAWSLEAEGPTSLSIQAGGANSFLVKITNKGNVAKEPPISVAASPAGWTAVLTGHAGNLAAGASREASVTLTAPAGAPQLAQGKATVTLAGAAPREFTGTVGASFGVDLSGPARVDGVIGNTTRLTLVVRNAGNAPDTLSVRAGALPAGWEIEFPDGAEIALGAGASADLRADVSVPAGTSPSAAVEVSFTAISEADPGKSDNHRVLVALPAPAEEESATDTATKGKKGSPGLSAAFVAVFLGLAAIARLRRV